MNRAFHDNLGQCFEYSTATLCEKFPTRKHTQAVYGSLMAQLMAVWSINPNSASRDAPDTETRTQAAGAVALNSSATIKDMAETNEPEDHEPAAAQSAQGESGLRDPQRAIRSLGAIIMVLEALVVLLTIVPLRMMRVDHLGLTISLMVFLTLACLGLAGFMRYRWAWFGGSAIQVVLLACGLIHWSLAGVGVIFGLTWWFSLTVRHRLSRAPVRE